MKKQIRRNVFETNSSSTHSLTMCMECEYDKWEAGELLFWEDENKFGTKEEIIEEMKTMKWYSGSLRYPDVDWNDEDQVYDIFSDARVKTFEQYFENEYYETYAESYRTSSNETVVAFGYFGYDC